MTKKAKILIFFSLIFLGLILYLILTSASVKKLDNSSLSSGRAGQAIKNQAALSDQDYQAKVKEIFNSFEKLSQDNGTSTEKIIGLRDKLISLKGLPAKFKDLHLKLVLALDRLEDYLKRNDQRGKNTSQQIGDQLKNDYGWLKN